MGEPVGETIDSVSWHCLVEHLRYAAVDFEFHLSPDLIATAIDTESETLEYLIDTYGQDSIEAILDIWEDVDQGELTYREASAMLEMAHADFLRGAAELDLFER